MSNESKRRDTNKEKILNLLLAKRGLGATNSELLFSGGFRYGARLFELRREGWDIETVAGQGGEFRFILKGRVQEQPTLFAEMRQ